MSADPFAKARLRVKFVDHVMTDGKKMLLLRKWTEGSPEHSVAEVAPTKADFVSFAAEYAAYQDAKKPPEPQKPMVVEVPATPIEEPVKRTRKPRAATNDAISY